jgi:hypothetical protein
MRLLLTIVLIAPLTLVWGRPAAADGPVPDLEAIRRGLAARDAAFQNLRFRVTYHAKIRKGPRGGPLLDKVQVADIVLDTSQGPGPENVRARAELLTTLDPDTLDLVPEGTTWGHQVSVVTPGSPEGGRTLGTGYNSVTKEPASVGYINEHSGVLWLAYPTEMLSLNYWSPGHHLTSPVKAWAVDGTEVRAGHEALRLRWTSEGRTPADGSHRGTYWIAPALGYAVLGSVVEWRRNAQSPFLEVMRIECDDFTEVDGLWLPGSARMVEHTVFNEDGAQELKREILADFENWALNRDLPAETFQLEFPKGTTVTDYTRGGVTYVVGRIDDAMIGRQVKKAQQLVATAPPPPATQVERFERAVQEDPFAGRARWLWMGLGAALALVVAALAAWLIAAHRRRRVEAAG